MKLKNILSFLPVATGILIISTTLPATGTRPATDLEREQRLAEELESLLDDMPPGSAQIRIEGASHYFDKQNKELVEAITGWLGKTVPPVN